MTTTSAALGVHLHDAELVGTIQHQKHKHSGGLYPVVTLAFGNFEFTIFPGRDRAIEMADMLSLMSDQLRAGAEAFAVQALSD